MECVVHMHRAHWATVRHKHSCATSRTTTTTTKKRRANALFTHDFFVVYYHAKPTGVVLMRRIMRLRATQMYTTTIARRRRHRHWCFRWFDKHSDARAQTCTLLHFTRCFDTLPGTPYTNMIKLWQCFMLRHAADAASMRACVCDSNARCARIYTIVSVGIFAPINNAPYASSIWWFYYGN